jgi:hypothetical protein
MTFKPTRWLAIHDVLQLARTHIAHFLPLAARHRLPFHHHHHHHHLPLHLCATARTATMPHSVPRRQHAPCHVHALDSMHDPCPVNIANTHVCSAHTVSSRPTSTGISRKILSNFIPPSSQQPCSRPMSVAARLHSTPDRLSASTGQVSRKPSAQPTSSLLSDQTLISLHPSQHCQ